VTEPARRWLTVLSGVMLLSLVSPVGAARAADALAAAEGRYSLVTSLSMSGEGSLSVNVQALQEAEAIPLSRAEAEAVEEAIGRLDRICSSDPEAAELLFAARPERALTRFGEVFGKADEKVRARIANLAARSDDPAAGSLVARALMDEESSVRRAAERTLELQGKDLPVGALMAAFKSAAPEAIARALEYVRDGNDAEVVDELRGYASHRSGEVRAKAVERLSALEGEGANGILRRALADGSHVVRQEALRGLSARGILTVEQIVEAISRAREEVTTTALEVMPRTSDPAMTELARSALRSRSEDHRKAGVTALGRMGNPDAIPLIVARMEEDSSWKVRAGAARALGEHGAVSDLGPLMRVAKGEKEKDRRVQQAAGEGLAGVGRRGVEAALAELEPSGSGAWCGLVEGLSAAPDPDLELLRPVARAQSAAKGEWKAVAEAAEKLSGKDKYALLALVLERGDGLGQAPAIDLLDADGSQQARGVLAAASQYSNILPRRKVDTHTKITETGGSIWMLTFEPVYEDIWRLVLDALPAEERGEAESALVIAALRSAGSSDAQVRAGCARVIGAHWEPTNSATPYVSAEEPVEGSKSGGLAGGQDTALQMMKVLERLAGDSSEVVRKATAEALRDIGDGALAPLARKLAKDRDSGVKRAAEGAVVRCAGEWREIAKAGLTCTDHDRQTELVDTLSLLGREAAVALGEVSEKAKQDDLSVKAMAKLVALAGNGELDASAVERALRGVLSGSSQFRQFVAACALAAVDAPGGLEALLETSAPSDSLLKAVMTAQLRSGGESGGLFDPSRVELVAALAFRSGSEDDFGYRTTHLFLAPIGVSRKGNFESGDRWPLSQQCDIGTDVDPRLIALANYDDPRVDERIREAAKSRRASERRSALWAMALRDDRRRVEEFLADRDRSIEEDAIDALRLMGHRASVWKLAPKVSESNTAAMAAVEMSLAAAAE